MTAQQAASHARNGSTRPQAGRASRPDYRVAVRPNGTLSAWGANACGQLGNDDTVERHDRADQVHRHPGPPPPPLSARIVHRPTAHCRYVDSTIGTDAHRITRRTPVRISAVRVGQGRCRSRLRRWRPHRCARSGRRTTTLSATSATSTNTAHQASSRASLPPWPASRQVTAAPFNSHRLGALGHDNNEQLGDGTTTTRTEPSSRRTATNGPRQPQGAAYGCDTHQRHALGSATTSGAGSGGVHPAVHVLTAAVGRWSELAVGSGYTRSRGSVPIARCGRG